MFYANAQQTTLNWDILRQEFAKLLMEEKPLKVKAETDFDFITTKGADIPLEEVRQYTKRLGVSLDSTPSGEVFINGKPVEMSGVCCIPLGYRHLGSTSQNSKSYNICKSKLDRRLSISKNRYVVNNPPTHRLTGVIQLYLGSLSGDIDDISVYFYDLPWSHKRRNKLVYPSGGLSNTQLTSLPQLFEATGFRAKAGSYLQWRKGSPEPNWGLFIYWF